MNIWIVDHYSSEPKYGGISRQYDFAREFSRRGHNVLVISSSFSHYTHSFISNKKCFISKINDKAHYAYVRTRPYLKNNGLKRLLNMLSFQPSVNKNYRKFEKEFGKPDIVVGCSIHPFAWKIAYKIAKKYKAKFFVEVRDLWPANQIYDEGKSKLNPEVIVWGHLEKWAYKRADKVIYSMSRGDKYLVDMFGLPKEKVIWIGQPLDRQRFNENANRYNELPVDIKEFIGDSFLCVFTGYYMDYEGVNEMVEAAGIIKQHNLPIKFVFVGSGAEKENMESYALNHNLDNVYIGGRIDKNLIPSLLKRSDICLVQLAVRGNPNSYQFDASKNKINEYMYSNSCIIYGTYVENQFIQTSGAGFTIDPFNSKALADKIIYVYNLPNEQRIQFGINARNFVDNNNAVEKLVDKYEELF